MQATLSMDHGMTFIGTADTGFDIQMDSSSKVGGEDSGFRPMELLLIGLGGCTAMDVISILRKKRQDVTAFEVKLQAKQNHEHPHVFTHINIHYIVKGRQVDAKAVARAIELSETKYCPAQAMMEKVAAIDHTYEVVEEE